MARELARGATPGGTLAAVLGGGAAGGEAYGVFLRLLRPILDATPADRRIPALGDRRVRHREGLDEILAPAGFTPVAWETVRIDLTAPFEQVWATVSGLYDLGPLPAHTRASLRESFTAETKELALPDGRIPCAMNIRVATARRRPT